MRIDYCIIIYYIIIRVFTYILELLVLDTDGRNNVTLLLLLLLLLLYTDGGVRFTAVTRCIIS